MDIEKMIETLRQHGVSCVRAYGRYCSICDEAATVLSTLQAENEKLRAELEQAREDNKKLSAAMMELKCKGDISKMTLVYELEYNSALSHASVEDIARIVFDGLMREHLRVRGQKED